MSWKKSKDGGLDFDVRDEMKRRELHRKYEEAKKKMFDRHKKADENLEVWKNNRNFGGSAHTVTFNTNIEHVEF